jgi:hypothetical protein
MLLALSKQQVSLFHFIFTGDESWMFYSYQREVMCVPSLRYSHFHILFKAFLITILPEEKKMASTYFVQGIIDSSAEPCDSDGQQRH